jgi:hypothetical protein
MFGVTTTPACPACVDAAAVEDVLTPMPLYIQRVAHLFICIFVWLQVKTMLLPSNMSGSEKREKM